MNALEQLAAVVGLAALTLFTRAFFMIPRREVPIPDWLREGLRYAPLAALVAVVAPEVLLRDGWFLDTWRDARLFAAAAGGATFWWRRNLLATILAGSVVLLALRLGLGW